VALSDDPEKRARQLGNLKPAVKGEPSRNPLGRPSTKALRDMLLAELGRRPFKDSPVTNLHLGINMMVKKFVAGDLGTTKLLFAYTWGLPTQPIELIRTEAQRWADELGCDAAELIAEAEAIAAAYARG
jgi:hypothetical protein